MKKLKWLALGILMNNIDEENKKVLRLKFDNVSSAKKERWI
jgi:hypothetical protein